jgi:hypothetical protein
MRSNSSDISLAILDSIVSNRLESVSGKLPGLGDSQDNKQVRRFDDIIVAEK